MIWGKFRRKNSLREILLIMVLLSVAIIIQHTAITKVDAGSQTSTYQVTITSATPTVSNIRCCFNSTGNPVTGQCQVDGGSFTITDHTNYYAVCNFTVSDANGYADMGDGWVNMTWFRNSVTWNSPDSNDNHYTNASCRNISSSANGNNINYECLIPNIKYYADAGTWNVVVNLSDGTGLGTPGTATYTITNVTSLWQTNSISFGSMNLGENGSQTQPNNVSVAAITNNTGNTRINIQVQAQANPMPCTLGSIGVSNISYDTSIKSIHSACGNLSTTAVWQCADIGLQDCSGTCSSEPTATTYWGIRIPASGVGGTCSLSVSFIALQA